MADETKTDPIYSAIEIAKKAKVRLLQHRALRKSSPALNELRLADDLDRFGLQRITDGHQLVGSAV